MTAQSDLGPVLPPRSLVYDRAHEIAALARIACECSAIGPGGDLARAVDLLGRIAALASFGEEEQGVGSHEDTKRLGCAAGLVNPGSGIAAQSFVLRSGLRPKRDTFVSSCEPNCDKGFDCGTVGGKR